MAHTETRAAKADTDAHVHCLRELNELYVKASLTGDVEWFRRHLADEFVCIDSDGAILDREAFLQHAAAGSDVDDYRLGQVDVAIYDRVALVRATGRWVSREGVPGISRYLDVYVFRDGEWKAVSAQITRPGPGTGA